MGKDAYTLYIKGILGSLEDTVEILDLFYYNSNTYSTNSVNLNVNLPTGAFKLEYDSTPTSRDSSCPYLDIGRSSNDRLLVGQYARAGGNGIIIYQTSSTIHGLPNNSSLNAVNHYTFIYGGSNYKIDRDGENLTVTSTGVHFDKIIHVEGGGGGTLTNIKVHKL